ncbi:MAG: diguanylate cyclase [Gemmatimonadetes bacterium]|nr:diguanylate cyclase [Gemmatimonadota bacterium]
MSRSTTPRHHPRPRILIVDDERKNRQLLEVMLAGEDYELVLAESGEEALQEVARRRPDLVLLDVMMPGMNGYEVAAALKGDAGTRHIPLVILSALDDRNSRVHGLTSGAEEFLTKPVNRQELLLRVRNLLRLAQEPPTGEERRSEENG